MLTLLKFFCFLIQLNLNGSWLQISDGEHLECPDIIIIESDKIEIMNDCYGVETSQIGTATYKMSETKLEFSEVDFISNHETFFNNGNQSFYFKLTNDTLWLKSTKTGTEGKWVRVKNNK